MANFDSIIDSVCGDDVVATTEQETDDSRGYHLDHDSDGEVVPDDLQAKRQADDWVSGTASE